MLQRCRLIVPFGELADDLANVDAGMEPFRTRRALVRLHDIAAVYQDGHPVAPGVVHGHGCVLQANHTVAGHRSRLAGNLGVTLRHVHGNILVHAGDDFRLVVAVIDDRFVQTAIARSAVDEHVLDAERVDDVGHEVAAARRLIDRIARGRQRLGCDLARTRQPCLGLLQRRSRHRRRCNRRCHRGSGAHKTCAFKEIAAISVSSRLTGFRHRILPKKGR